MQKFATVDEALEYFTKKQKECLDAEIEFKKKMDEYRREAQEYFGFAEGQQMNFLQLVTLIRRFAK